jgi:TolB-like protein
MRDPSRFLEYVIIIDSDVRRARNSSRRYHRYRLEGNRRKENQHFRQKIRWIDATTRGFFFAKKHREDAKVSSREGDR